MLGDPTPNCLWPSSMHWSQGRRCLELGIPSPIRWRMAPPFRAPPCVPLPATPPRTTASSCWPHPRQVPAAAHWPLGLRQPGLCAQIDGFYEVPAGRRGFGAGGRRAGADVRPYKAAADKFGIDSIFIAPPNGDAETLQQVAELGNGYTYLVSRAGVTGAETRPACRWRADQYPARVQCPPPCSALASANLLRCVRPSPLAPPVPSRLRRGEDHRDPPPEPGAYAHPSERVCGRMKAATNR